MHWQSEITCARALYENNNIEDVILDDGNTSIFLLLISHFLLFIFIRITNLPV